jgi:arylsulfatase A-like enzyme
VLTKTCGLADGFDDYVHDRAHDATLRRAHDFLDDRERDERPYLLLLHTNIPHDYYLPLSQQYYEQVFPDRSDWFALGYKVLSYPGVTPEQREIVRRTYDACARACDDALDAVFDRLAGSDTVVAFVADHGEGFDVERGRVHHGGRMHDDLLRTPCAIHVPASAPTTVHEGMRAAQHLPVTSKDLMPTLLALAGTSPGGPVEGTDIATLGHDAARRMLRAHDFRYMYLANRFRLNTNARGKNMSRRAKARNRVLRATIAQSHHIRAYIDPPYKLVVSELHARDTLLAKAGVSVYRRMRLGSPVISRDDSTVVGLELFDLDVDPGERTNLLLDRPALAGAVAPIVAGVTADGLGLRECVAG